MSSGKDGDGLDAAADPYDSSKPNDKQGFLNKRGGRYKSWKSRWFILQGSSLFYFAAPGESRPKGSVNLLNTVVQYTDVPGKQFCFKVVTKDRDYYISAESEQERGDWKKWLEEGSSPRKTELSKEDSRISGSLVVKLIEAENLAVKDLGGTSDPFAVLICEGQQFRSNTIQKQLNPVWNEETHFDVTSAKSELHVVLWDEDRVLGVQTAPDFLGCVFIPLTRVSKSADIQSSSAEYVLNDWFQVHPRKPNEFVRGRVHLELRLRVRDSSKGSSPDQVFGVSLSQAVERAPHRSGIPLLVRTCFDYIELNAMELVGIFRLSGSVGDIQKLKDDFNQPNHSGDAMIPPNTDPNAVAGLLKSFLRELDPPLIPFEAYDAFLGVGHDAKKAKPILKKLISEMPLLNKILLQYLLIFCHKVAQHHTVNKMDTQNLAIVFAPNILRPEVQGLDFVLKIMEVSSVFKIMIDVHRELFDAPLPPEWNPEETKLGESMANPNLVFPKLNIKARVLYAFAAQEENELTVAKGQVVYILEQDSTGWSICSTSDPQEHEEQQSRSGIVCGLVPTSYLKPVK